MGFFTGVATSAISAISNLKIAKRQMDFQERMSNTAHQRQMEDLRKAGINPILSARLGGATTPPGAAIPINLTDPGNPVTQALTARESKKRGDTEGNRTEVARKQAELLGAQKLQSIATAKQAAAQADNIDVDTRGKQYALERQKAIATGFGGVNTAIESIRAGGTNPLPAKGGVPAEVGALWDWMTEDGLIRQYLRHRKKKEDNSSAAQIRRFRFNGEK